jgi:septum site-determining protein MinC
MAAVPTAPIAAAFDLKSASLTLVALLLRTTDLTLLAQEFDARFADTPGLFDRDPLVVDLSAVAQPVDDGWPPLDMAALVALLQRYKLQPIAAKGGSAEQMEGARAAGLVDAPEDGRAPAPRVVEVPGPAPEPVIVEVPVQTAASATLIVDKPLRSGQQVYARGGDLVVLAVVNFGAEVIADGSIHVYAPLRGRAVAGAKGDTTARIFSTCMEPQLVSIAGTYRTTDTALPADVHGKPAQVGLGRGYVVGVGGLLFMSKKPTSF